MNLQKVRLAQINHMSQALYSGRGPVAATEAYKSGEELIVREDMELEHDGEQISIPAGSVARVVEFTGEDLALDFGKSLGGCKMKKEDVDKYLNKTGRMAEKEDEPDGDEDEKGDEPEGKEEPSGKPWESRSPAEQMGHLIGLSESKIKKMKEASMMTPGRKVTFTKVDPSVGDFRPNLTLAFGLESLVGKVGEIVTVFMGLPTGVTLYKVNFDMVGIVIVADSEFTVLE